MKVIIPAAGYATRLWPLTKDQPKALLKVKEKPIVEHIIDKVHELGVVDHIYIVSNDKFFKHFQDWSSGFSSPIPVTVLNDGTLSNADRMGQIGDIQYVIDKASIGDDTLIIAGDNLFNFSLVPIYDFFKKKQAIVNGLWDCQSKENSKQLGIASVDDEKRMISFVEKPDEPPSTLASLGIYFFPKEDLKLIKLYLDEGHGPDKMGHFVEWALSNGEVFGYTYFEKWFDIGWKEALLVAEKEFVPNSLFCE